MSTSIPIIERAETVKVVRVDDTNVALIFGRVAVDQNEDGKFVTISKAVASILIPTAALLQAAEVAKAEPNTSAAPAEPSTSTQ